MPDQDETQPPGAQAGIDDDDEDVEGHRGMSPRAAGGPDDFGQMRVSRPRVDGDDDDVEGHYGQLKSPSSRGE